MAIINYQESHIPLFLRDSFHGLTDTFYKKVYNKKLSTREKIEIGDYVKMKCITNLSEAFIDLITNNNTNKFNSFYFYSMDTLPNLNISQSTACDMAIEIVQSTIQTHDSIFEIYIYGQNLDGSNTIYDMSYDTIRFIKRIMPFIYADYMIKYLNTHNIIN